ncbi:MAG: hypothetical protein ACJ74O_06285 [Frankiaceae bacterium]
MGATEADARLEAVKEPKDKAERVAALVDELTHARWRGLDDLELSAGQQSPVETPELERLARIYTRDRVAPRIPLIRRLLDEGLDAWRKRGNADEADFVRAMFFAADGGTPGQQRPKQLKAAVLQRYGLNEDRFEDRRRTSFRRFAAFLLEFVAVPPPRPWRRWLIAAGLALVLAVVGIGSFLALHRGGSTGAQGSGRSASSPDTTATGPTATFTFDALGGTSSKIIDVYPGVGTSAHDKNANGTFTDGDTAPALCKTTGRRITSDVSAGERPRSSNIWVRVQGSPGLVQYATLTYGDIGRAALSRLPHC